MISSRDWYPLVYDDIAKLILTKQKKYYLFLGKRNEYLKPAGISYKIITF
jgi:hypothetical protein